MSHKIYLPEGWSKCSLEDIIVDSRIGLVRSAKEQNTSGVGLPYIKMNNVDTQGNIDLSDNLVFVEASEEEAKRYALVEGDLLLNTRNSFELVGKTGIVKNTLIPRVYNNNLLRLRFKDHIDSSFINYQFYSLAFKQLLLSGKKATTNICALYQKDLFPLPIIYPSLPEQKLIVAKLEELFSELDKGKEQLETARQQLKVYRQAVLKWAFEGRFTNPEVKEGELPEGWKLIEIKEVAEINPKIPDREKIEDDLEVQFIPMKLVEEVIGKVHLAETRKYSEVKKGYTAFVNKDVIFAKVTPCMENGKIAVVNNLLNGIGFGSTEFHVIRANPGLNNQYLFHFLVQERFRKEAGNEMTGAVGLRRVPKQFIEKYVIPLPPLKEQIQIVQEVESRLSVCDKVEETINQSLQQAETLRQSILKQAFEGKLFFIKFK